MTPDNDNEFIQEVKREERLDRTVIWLLSGSAIALLCGFAWVMSHYVR